MSRPQVLVVDDSRVIRKAIDRVLGKEYDLVEAEDGEAGWEALESDPRTRVVISDIQMPRLDGYGMICRIRAAEDQRLRDLPIIVITSAEDDTTKERAYACGANDFILKPIDSNQLLGCVQNHTTGTADPSALSAALGGTVEEAVIEEPDVNTALALLANGSAGSIDPYVSNLALKVMPLLEYCNKHFDLELDEELEQLKKKLKRV